MSPAPFLTPALRAALYGEGADVSLDQVMHDAAVVELIAMSLEQSLLASVGRDATTDFRLQAAHQIRILRGG